MPTSADPRLPWPDAGRGIAIVLVVLFHAANWLAVPQWQAANEYLATLRMPLFFTISGIFAGPWMVRSWRKLLASKLSLFAWVSMIWVVVGELVLALGLATQNQDFHALTAVRTILLFPITPVLELWFLWALFYFFIASRLLSRIPGAVILVAAGVVSMAAFSGVHFAHFGLDRAARYYFFFAVGLHGQRYAMRLARVPATWAVAVLAGWVVVTVLANGAFWSHGWILAFPNCVMGAAAGICLSRFVQRVYLLRYLGRRTLQIYVAHTPIIICLSWLLWLAFGDPSPAWWGGLLVPAVASVAIVAALQLHRIAAPRVPWLYEAPAIVLGAFVRHRAAEPS